MQTLLSDPDFVDEAIKRLSVSFLFNLMPWESSRLLLDLLNRKSLTKHLNDAEQESLQYYQKFLNLKVDHSTPSSIQLVSSVLALKQEVSEHQTLPDNWKQTIVSGVEDTYEMRDTIASLYAIAKERFEFLSSTQKGQSQDSSDS